jgi:predicted heme/steroid binding protein/uncharacterized membrane protein
MKVYNPEELAKENGQNGSRALVAVRGKVFDVSASKRWPNGKHMNRHSSGKDLTQDISAAPHGPEVLERFEKVGTYEETPANPRVGFRATLDRWLSRYPFFRRHPHPAVVHFPVALASVGLLFEAIALATGSGRTEWAAYCCLMVCVISLPAAVGTGYLTWWINYEAARSPVIRKKQRLAWAAVVISLLALVTRTLAVDDPLSLREANTILYLFDLLGLAVVVSCVGYLGGTLTFPYDHR